ncbi:FecR family protein [Pedobacter foliorum]|uniref:FecR family protein n=1 Tax=Pedobacter foliorum TaxID=2739058 RepID=UPI0015633AF4|nr:FecR family protein [Pedobacter foliorum]NRF37812.1 FecR domain-containing protein [Pedobacter foliorum]
MTPEQYILLYEKYIAGNASPDEVLLLLQYRDNFVLEGEKPSDLSLDEELIKNRILGRIDTTIAQKERKTFKLKWWIAAAAISAIILTIGTLFIKKQPEKLIPKSQGIAKSKRIKPGSNMAILTLSDGSEVILNDAKNGEIAKSSQVSIKKIKNGLLTYDPTGKPDKPDSNAINTITIPRGGKYTISLPDGTSVWLNSESSLTYPVAFSGGQRKVKLKGEAYFEVAKNKRMPFVVETNKMTAKVLGTHFNINCYKEDPEIKTTLLEGSIRVTNERSSVLLIPGEQAIAGNPSGRIQTRKVDADQVIAWKNGYFIFRNDNIQAVMTQISRWYDVDVEYRGNMEHKNFGGIYAKNKDINELLKGLELTGNIHFKIEGRRIIVMA